LLSNYDILSQQIASIKNKLDAAAIPAARKADLRGMVSKLEVCKYYCFWMSNVFLSQSKIERLIMIFMMSWLQLLCVAGST